MLSKLKFLFFILLSLCYSCSKGDEVFEEKKEIVLATEIYIENSELSITEGDTLFLEYKILPENTTDKSIQVSSNNPSIVSINKQGDIIAKSVGTTKLVLTTSNGIKSVFTVTVKKLIIAVESIAIENQDLSINKNKRVQLKTKIYPENASDKLISWSSSDNNIATVDATGVITALNEGSVTIYAKSANDKEATCNVTVLPLSYEDFYQLHTFGLAVKDTSGLRGIVTSKINDIKLLVASKEGNLWFGKFDAATGEEIYGIKSTETVESLYNMHVGYGEYVKFTPKALSINCYLPESKGDAFSIKFEDRTQSNYLSMNMLITNEVIYCHRFVNENVYLRKWWDGTFIHTFYKGSYEYEHYIYRFGKTSYEILDGRIISYDYPISMTEYINIGVVYYPSRNKSIFKQYMGASSNASYRWIQSVNICKDDNAKITEKLVEQNDRLWTWRFDVIEYSGEKHSHLVKINVDTGEDFSITDIE